MGTLFSKIPREVYTLDFLIMYNNSNNNNNISSVILQVGSGEGWEYATLPLPCIGRETIFDRHSTQSKYA